MKSYNADDQRLEWAWAMLNAYGRTETRVLLDRHRNAAYTVARFMFGGRPILGQYDVFASMLLHRRIGRLSLPYSG